MNIGTVSIIACSFLLPTSLLLALFGDHQLRVTDDVDEQHMADLEFYI